MTLRQHFALRLVKSVLSLDIGHQIIVNCQKSSVFGHIAQLLSSIFSTPKYHYIKLISNHGHFRLTIMILWVSALTADGLRGSGLPSAGSLVGKDIEIMGKKHNLFSTFSDDHASTTPKRFIKTQKNFFF